MCFAGEKRMGAERAEEKGGIFFLNLFIYLIMSFGHSFVCTLFTLKAPNYILLFFFF